MLSLVDELVMLSYDDRGRNAIRVGNVLNSCLMGAALLELYWRGRLHIDEETVVARDSTPTGENVLDRVLEALGTQDKTLNPHMWTRLSRPLVANLRKVARSTLVERGVLCPVRRRRLLVFPVLVYEATSPAILKALTERVRQAALGLGNPDLRTRVLAVLCDLAYLSSRLFSSAEIPPAKRRLRELEKELGLGQVTGSEDPAQVAVGAVMQGVAEAQRQWNEEGHSM